MVGTLAMPAQANAGLLDWLFPGRAERVARRWSRATTAYRPVAATGTTGRTTSFFGGNFAGGQNFGSGGYYLATVRGTVGDTRATQGFTRLTDRRPSIAHNGRPSP